MDRDIRARRPAGAIDLAVTERGSTQLVSYAPQVLVAQIQRNRCRRPHHPVELLIGQTQRCHWSSSRAPRPAQHITSAVRRTRHSRSPRAAAAVVSALKTPITSTPFPANFRGHGAFARLISRAAAPSSLATPRSVTACHLTAPAFSRARDPAVLPKGSWLST